MSPEACLKDREIYFSFEGDYNYMPYFLNMVGEDRVMGALDFPHTHYGVGANLSVALDLIRNHKELTESQKKKVLLDNSVAFYGFKDI